MPILSNRVRKEWRWLPKNADQETLFPLLEQTPLYTHRSFASLVGDFYEIVIAALIDAHVLGVNGKIPLCPDLLRRKVKSVIEVKGSGYSGNMISMKQLEKYQELRDEQKYEIWYALCGYYRDRSTREGGVLNSLSKKNYAVALQFLAQHTSYALMLDFDIIQKLVTYYGTYSYPKWDTEYLRISPGKCLKFVNDPGMLLNMLELNRSDYVIIQTYADALRIADNDVIPFPVTFVIKREEQMLNIAPEEFKVLKDILTDKREQEDEVPF